MSALHINQSTREIEQLGHYSLLLILGKRDIASIEFCWVSPMMIMSDRSAAAVGKIPSAGSSNSTMNAV
jgi:hypothetical protein